MNLPDKQDNNMGLAISMGAGIGLVIGSVFFEEAGLGISLGALAGIFWASFTKSKSKS